MRIYLWLAVGEGSPTIVAATRHPDQMEMAIQRQVEAQFGFWPQWPYPGARPRYIAEQYLLSLGYTQIISLATELREEEAPHDRSDLPPSGSPELLETDVCGAAPGRGVPGADADG